MSRTLSRTARYRNITRQMEVIVRRIAKVRFTSHLAPRPLVRKLPIASPKLARESVLPSPQIYKCTTNVCDWQKSWKSGKRVSAQPNMKPFVYSR